MGQITDIPHRAVNAKAVSSNTTITAYQAGTSTLVLLFSDETHTIPVANPFTVTTGNPIPILYYSYAGAVRVNVADTSGMLFDDDPYDRPVSQLKLASPYGGEMLGFEQAGSGTITRSVTAKLREVVSIDDFAGTTVARLKAAAAELAARGGGTLLIPHGRYEAASSELTSAVTVPSNVTVEGSGSTIEITGEAITHALFAATNASNLKIRNMTVIGNSQASGYNDGAFLNCIMNNGATADMRNIRVEDVHLENFKAPWWLYIANFSTTYHLTGVTVQRVSAASRNGNAMSPNDIAVNSAVVVIRGGDDDALVENIVVRDIWVEATYIKTGVILYYKIDGAIIENVTVLSAGTDPAFGDDKGCYAIQLYGLGGNILVRRVCLSARSCGVYVASMSNVTIEDFEIFGQTDNVTATLPKGAIVINGAKRHVVRNGTIHDCTNGVQLIGPNVTGRLDGLVDNVKAHASVIVPLVVRPAAAIDMDGLTIRNSRFVGTVRGGDIRVSTAETAILNDLTIQNCHFEGGLYGFDAYSLNAAHSSANWKFTDTYFGGGDPGTGVRIRSMSGRLVMRDCRAACPGAGQAIQLVDSTTILLHNLEAAAGGGGVAFALTNARGTTTGFMRAVGATNPVQGLGAGKPTHSGVKGDYVAAISYTTAPAGDGQTQITGWRCDGSTTWRPVVETVNAA